MRKMMTSAAMTTVIPKVALRVDLEGQKASSWRT